MLGGGGRRSRRTQNKPDRDAVLGLCSYMFVFIFRFPLCVSSSTSQIMSDGAGQPAPATANFYI